MKRKLTTHSFRLLLTASFFIPFLSFGAELQSYQPLVTIPGVQNTGFGNLPQYLNNLYLALIGIGALVAVVKIIMAGVKWSFSGIVTDKAAAKSDIRGALLGLAILLAPYIVLNEINPELTNFNFLRNVVTIDLSTRTSTSGGLTAIETNNESRRFCEQSRGVYEDGTCNRPPDGSNDLNENRRFCEQGGGSFELSTGTCTSAPDPTTGATTTVPTGSYTYQAEHVTGTVMEAWIEHCGGAARVNMQSVDGGKKQLSCK